MQNQLHTPVLFHEVREVFTTRKYIHPHVIDATLGLGGHAGMFLDEMEGGVFLGFDRDSENLSRASDSLSGKGNSVEKYLIPENFTSLRDECLSRGIESVHTILYDLGVSSVHYDDPLRGFSIRDDGPLDMRFDRRRGKTAADIIALLDAPELARIFSLYGEEKKSWFIADAIVKKRKIKKIDTTMKLLRLIEASSFDKKSPIRVFQALRIAVNEEFAHIENSLEQALELLSPGGICMVITFHSLEDRLVKQFFAPYLEDTIDDVTGQIREKARYRKLTKKPIEPMPSEIEQNPRSRSAKMRIIERVWK